VRLWGLARQNPLQEGGEIPLCARRADRALDPSRGDVKAGDQRLGAMALVLELTPLDLAGPHRPRRSDPLQGLKAGRLIDRDRADPGLYRHRRSLIQGTDLSALDLELRIGLGREPHPDPVRLEVGFFLECAPLSAARSSPPRRAGPLGGRVRSGSNA
jgi:hypothetical protein